MDLQVAEAYIPETGTEYVITYRVGPPNPVTGNMIPLYPTHNEIPSGNDYSAQ